MPGMLDEKVAIITGAAQGIGAAYSRTPGKRRQVKTSGGTALHGDW